jgi:hypothetical protein
MANSNRDKLRRSLEEAMQELTSAREQNLNAYERNTSDNNPEAQVSSDNPGDWSIELPNEVKDVGTEVLTAPTANPVRPRAYTIGYNHNTNTVIIVFRSGAWWQYEDVSVEVWMGLKNSSSTNKYLPILEQACSSHGPANTDALSGGTKERFSYSASQASRIQNKEPLPRVPTWTDIFFGPQE